MKPAYIFHLDKFNDYLSFIKECESKQYDKNLVIHKHHIYPRYLKLSERELKNKIVKLSVEDHITAHVMFAECFNIDSKESLSSLRAAKLLSKNSIRYKDKFLLIYEAQKGDLNPSKLPENKIKISQGLKDYFSTHTNPKKGKTYREIYGDRYEEEILKRSKTTRTVEEYKISAQKSVDTRKSNNKVIKGKQHKWSKPVIINGITYECAREAKEKLNLSHYKYQKITNKQYL